MPRVCTICSNPEKEAINQALVDNGAFRTIAARFGLSHQALMRHKAEHLPAVMVKSAQAREIAHADHLLEEANRLYQVATDIMEETRKNKPDTALRAIQVGGRLLELLGELLGELRRNPVTNILIAPEWLQVRALLMHALADYPEARASVARALLEVERGDG